MNNGGVPQAIRSMILEKFPASRKRTLSDDTPLLEAGIIDSLGVLDVVAFLEGKFSIKVEDDDLVPDNFGSILRLSAFVEKKQSSCRY